MDTRPADTAVGAVVALKPIELAKSRLRGVPDPVRRRLAWTMAVDTLRALAAATDRLLVVSDEPSLEARLRHALSRAPGQSTETAPVTVLAEPGPVGMNGALRYGSERLAALGYASVLACVGDLPALRLESLHRVLDASRAFPRSFVADASGVGTTMLIAHGTALEPHFQGPSAAAHRRSGARDLDAGQLGSVPDARRDVDTETDLTAAFHLGLAAATALLLDPETGALGRYDVITVADQRHPSGDQLAMTSTGHRIRLPGLAIADAFREVRAGQRLHAVTTKDRVLAAWL
ncbi:MAG: 2-phospho-L-lactate guanylyltransferase [Propionibacteriaceae bacterium]|nr:2-phospho-L-lactate guanylyltransferase [Propionibacteriaceae bacterium]